MDEQAPIHEVALDLLLDASAAAAAGSGAAVTSHERGLLRLETLQFSARMKADHDIVVTLADVREALGTLFAQLHGEPESTQQSPVRQALARLYLDRLTLFRS